MGARIATTLNFYPGFVLGTGLGGRFGLAPLVLATAQQISLRRGFDTTSL
jgi:hypothetical protein